MRTKKTGVLVTGAPGWLGNRLAERLSGEYKVRCLVLRGMDVSELKKMKVEIVEGDITKKETLDEATKGIEIIFHCAGIIHPKKIKELYEVNYSGTRNLVDSAIKNKVKRFIYISSNSPVGCNKNKKLFDESSPYNPYKNYGKSKMLSEIYLNKLFKEGKIETVIIRPCWFYGPGQPPRQTTFFKMIQKGNPIIFGNGNNLRSMSYIDNTIEGLMLAAKSKKAVGETYWLADEKPYSTMEIYETIAKLLNVKLKPRFVPGIASEMMEFFDDILQSLGFYIKEVHVAGEMNKDIACSVEKAKRDLGYNPKISLREGMKSSIDWCKENKLL